MFPNNHEDLGKFLTPGSWRHSWTPFSDLSRLFSRPLRAETKTSAQKTRSPDVDPTRRCLSSQIGSKQANNIQVQVAVVPFVSQNKAKKSTCNAKHVQIVLDLPGSFHVGGRLRSILWMDEILHNLRNPSKRCRIWSIHSMCPSAWDSFLHMPKHKSNLT